MDMTNFATYVDSANDKVPIAQRGKAKQKRTYLRLVGLDRSSPGTAGSHCWPTPTQGTAPTSRSPRR